MNLRHLTVGILMAAASVSAAAHTLTIDGQKVEKTVATITFDGDNAILTFSDNSTSSHDLSSVSLDFSSDTHVGIADIAVGVLSVSVGESITLAGAPEGTPVKIYNMRGVAVKSITTLADETIIPLDGLEGGVYVLRCGNEIVKFVKR